MTDHLAAPGPATTGRPPWVVGVVGAVVIVLAGLASGLLWSWVAPTAATTIVDGSIYLRGHDDLMASQDGWYAVLAAVTGGLLSAVWVPLTRRSPVAGVMAGLLGSAAAALVAWWVGTALGPDSLTAQYHAGVKAPITPIVLHTPIAVLVAPMVFATVRVLMELVAYAFANVHTPTPEPAGSMSAAQGVHVQQGQ